LIGAGRDDGERKPSIVPATTKKHAQPITIRAASMPLFFAACARVRSPGTISEYPIIIPAPAQKKMQDNSITPCPTTNDARSFANAGSIL